jgi:hypothetical protein
LVPAFYEVRGASARNPGASTSPSKPSSLPPTHMTLGAQRENPVYFCTTSTRKRK